MCNVEFDFNGDKLHVLVSHCPMSQTLPIQRKFFSETICMDDMTGWANTDTVWSKNFACANCHSERPNLSKCEICVSWNFVALRLPHACAIYKTTTSMSYKITTCIVTYTHEYARVSEYPTCCVLCFSSRGICILHLCKQFVKKCIFHQYCL